MSDREPCTSQARWRRFWPGKAPDEVCDAHADDTRAVGTALGTPIHLEPIGDTGEEPGRCSCSKGHPQTVVIG